jgi:hypothetical protein
MTFKLNKGDQGEKNKAEKWFKEYDGTFSNQKTLELNLEARKAEEKEFNMKLTAHLESFNLIIRENDIVDSLKNLQYHVGFFKNVLGDQDQLKHKVIEHIKVNFIKGLNAANVNTSQNQ